MMLIDSNLLIYGVQPEYKNLRDWIVDQHPSYSIISRVEVLGFSKLQPIAKQALNDLLGSLELIYLNPSTYEIAIELKQQRKISLGDALIAATCIEHSKTLATHNIEDFKWIENFRVIDPMLTD